MVIINTPVFAQSSIDRMAHLRSSINEIEQCSSLHATKYIFVFNSSIVLNNEDGSCFFSHNNLPNVSTGENLRVFLGNIAQEYYFAVALEKPPINHYEVMDVRSFALQNIFHENMGLIAQAVSTLNWHANHQFCANCGSQTEINCSGWRRDCILCKKQHSPRIDPVVIMLVTQGEHCLLGSGQDFTEKRYSCLAGFMEPGETIEDAARRELFEEVGITGEEVNYIMSQPWPFPSSLMIGVHIEVSNKTIKIDSNELRDAIWVKKSEVLAVLNGASDLGFSLPPRIAIAHTLLEYWVRT